MRRAECEGYICEQREGRHTQSHQGRRGGNDKRLRQSKGSSYFFALISGTLKVDQTRVEIKSALRIGQPGLVQLRWNSKVTRRNARMGKRPLCVVRTSLFNPPLETTYI